MDAYNCSTSIQYSECIHGYTHGPINTAVHVLCWTLVLYHIRIISDNRNFQAADSMVLVRCTAPVAYFHYSTQHASFSRQTAGSMSQPAHVQKQVAKIDRADNSFENLHHALAEFLLYLTKEKGLTLEFLCNAEQSQFETHATAQVVLATSVHEDALKDHA